MHTPARASDRPYRRLIWFVAGIAAAALPCWILWGFTVDDALIPARYAHHLAIGEGYRFNVSASEVDATATDGVTPLPFSFLLTPFARSDVMIALLWAKILGLIAWLVSCACLFVHISGRRGGVHRFGGALLLATSAPLAAWAVAGLSMGIATALSTFGLLLKTRSRDFSSTLCLGLAATLRPELVAYAMIMGAAPRAHGAGDQANGEQRRRLLGALGALVPFVIVAVVRGAWFGDVAPLSATAKAPNVELGLMYASACALLCGGLVVCAPFALWRAGWFERWVVLAIVCHFVVVATVGGDWMPLSRLVVPVLPAIAWVYVALATTSHWASSVARLLVAIAGHVWVWVQVGPSAARVGPDRAALVEEMRPVLSGASRIATVDIGWVGAATEGPILDLAGVTDPAVAALPGGHTTKRVPYQWLERRQVDTLVLLLASPGGLAEPWSESRFSRGVELWLAWQPAIARGFEVRYVSRSERLPYVVLRRKRSTESEAVEPVPEGE